MVKLLKKAPPISCTETMAITGDHKGTTNANPVNDIQTKISSLTERKTISFLNRKMTERMYERVDDRLEADTGS